MRRIASSREKFRQRFVLAGFTLVELMVTVGVIAILGGLAFPVYNRVSATAERAECTSRMRSVGMAILLFEGDQERLPGPTEDGYFMAPGGGGLADVLVAGDFLPEEGDHWFCPSNRFFREAGIAFAINNSDSTNPPYLFGEQIGPDQYQIGRSIVQIQDNLTNLWLLSDIDAENFVGSTSGVAAVESEAPFMILQKDKDPTSSLSSVTPVHRGRRNYMFFDGHIEILGPDDWPMETTSEDAKGKSAIERAKP